MFGDDFCECDCGGRCYIGWFLNYGIVVVECWSDFLRCCGCWEILRVDDGDCFNGFVVYVDFDFIVYRICVFVDLV